MKARKVKLDPGATFEKDIRRTLAVRLDEMDSFAPAARDPAAIEALHDLRIATKRVRYILEVGEPVLAGADERVKTAKRLQDLLGEIHDCDELLPLIEAHVQRLRDEDAAAAIANEPLPNRRKYRGLEALRAHTVARRARLHQEFVDSWPRVRKYLEAREGIPA